MRHKPRGVASPLGAAVLLLVCAGASAAFAQDDPGDGTPDTWAEEIPQTPSERLRSLEDKVDELEEKLRQATELKIRPETVLTVGGYVDFGFFVPQGNGSGWVQDFGNAAFPQYAGRYGWVFLGDILAPTVNSRGEVADLGDAPGVRRFDSIHSRGAPGFILNEANLGLAVGLRDNMLVTTSVNFLPRTGSDFTIGDFIELDIAQLEWMPFESRKTSIFVGKFDSVLGIEYRERKANQRFGITPSLIARYTTGTPLGVKVRTKLLPNDLLTIALALTNGSSTTEQFHFYDEIDSNAGKTVSGRVSFKLPLPGSFELGVSGEYGPQDRTRTNSEEMWFAGLDLLWNVGRLNLKAQWLRGGSDGNAVDRAYGLRLNHGAYLEADVMVTPLIGVLVRGELRDAFVFLADERAYLTKSWRGTLGLRVAFTRNVALKAEYLLNGEYGGLPQVPNNMFTSSLLLTY
jgi:hypothetical protein